MIQTHSAEEPEANWGGPWTEKKLDAFAKYVWSYLSIMKKYPYWKTIYFDGFAGSGIRKKQCQSQLYQKIDLTFEEEQVYKGSAERILNLKDNLIFDYYYFIDRNEQAVCNLEAKLSNTKESENKKLIFRPGDCNEQLIGLANSLKKKVCSSGTFGPIRYAD